MAFVGVSFGDTGYSCYVKIGVIRQQKLLAACTGSLKSLYPTHVELSRLLS